MTASQDKKKSTDGHITTGFLYYDRSCLPEYQLYHHEGDSQTELYDESTSVSFGVDGAVLSEAFPKTALKATSLLKFFNKSGGKSIVYTKDKGKAEFTLKTMVGFAPAESTTKPEIIIGSSAGHPFLSSKKVLPAPTISLTVEEFDDICGGMKRNEGGNVKIVVHEHGVKMTASEYGNAGKDVNYFLGTLTTPIDNFTMDAKFFTKMHGQLEKFCHGRSIVKLYFGRAPSGSGAAGNAVISLVFSIGYSGHFMYQKQIVQ